MPRMNSAVIEPVMSYTLVAWLTYQPSPRLAPIISPTTAPISAIPMQMRVAVSSHGREAAKKFVATVPLGRLAEVDEIKGLALLLASPASSYMTGALIPIDGGTAVM